MKSEITTMNTSLKSLLLVTVAITCLSVSSQAAVLINWGESGGDTGIVTANASGINPLATTYNPALINSPADGTSGYADPAPNQTRTFYAAQSADGAPIVNNSGAGDRIQMVRNFGGAAGTLTSMIAWPTLSAELQSTALYVEFAGRDNTAQATAHFLIETGDGWYRSTENQTRGTTFGVFSSLSRQLTWNGFSEFGITAGVPAANLADIETIGVYFTTTSPGGRNNIGGLLRFVSVQTLAPEPSSLALLMLGCGLLSNRRRRKMTRPANA